MRLPTPKFEHPEEIYAAIIYEHRENPQRMGEVLMACGWTMVDAARAVVDWNLRTVAAAIANERAKRNVRLTSLSEEEIARLKRQMQTEKKTAAAVQPRKATQTAQTALIDPRAPQKPPEFKP